MNLGQPLWLELARVRYGSGVVAEEIPATKNMALRDVVINFPNRIIGADIVRKSEGYQGWIGGVSPVIGWKSCAIARDGRT